MFEKGIGGEKRKNPNGIASLQLCSLHFYTICQVDAYGTTGDWMVPRLVGFPIIHASHRRTRHSSLLVLHAITSLKTFDIHNQKVHILHYQQKV